MDEKNVQVDGDLKEAATGRRGDEVLRGSKFEKG
jgi:hypothetical protein